LTRGGTNEEEEEEEEELHRKANKDFACSIPKSKTADRRVATQLDARHTGDHMDLVPAPWKSSDP
jgi:hypothetical protein